MPRSDYRYGPYDDGPDPLAPPYDVAEAIDALGEDVLAGASPPTRCASCSTGAPTGCAGSTRCAAAPSSGSGRCASAASSTAPWTRSARCSTRPSPWSRAPCSPTPPTTPGCASSSSTTCPPTTAQAVQELSDYDWRSPQARETYDQIGELLRAEVLDQQFRA